jgi:hypothetical protein
LIPNATFFFKLLSSPFCVFIELSKQNLRFINHNSFDFSAKTTTFFYGRILSRLCCNFAAMGH